MPGQTERGDRPSFSLSNEQAQVLSCLLEIDLTLTVAAVREHQHRRKRVWSVAGENLPLDAMGRCDASRAAVVGGLRDRNSSASVPTAQRSA
jgi:hypothetical protein